jgi:3-hydroxybutyryl-CoA dehydrogenase
MERIAIPGGGLMGHGVARVFACAGHAVRITDPAVEARAQIHDDHGMDRAALADVEVAETLEACVEDANFVIEAAPEDLELKQRIFENAERAAPRHTILFARS